MISHVIKRIMKTKKCALKISTCKTCCSSVRIQGEVYKLSFHWFRCFWTSFKDVSDLLTWRKGSLQEFKARLLMRLFNIGHITRKYSRFAPRSSSMAISSTASTNTFTTSSWTSQSHGKTVLRAWTATLPGTRIKWIYTKLWRRSTSSSTRTSSTTSCWKKYMSNLTQLEIPIVEDF